MARKFHIVRKRWSNLEKNVVLVEELIDAGGFVVVDGNLMFYNENEELMIATPAGTWLEVEEVEERQEASTVIEGEFGNGHSEHAVRT